MSKIKQQIKGLVNKLPYVRTLIKELAVYKTDYAPGHYHSPIISVEEIKKREAQIFPVRSKEITGIDLNEDEQIALLKAVAENYRTIPFADEKQSNLRYYYNNGFYCQSDGIFLHLMMRHFKPRRIIEVGSGFSSACMLDTNELFFDNSIQLTFIEPNTDRLYSLFKNKDKTQHKTIDSFLQNVDLALFDQLEPNDILFIDSTHVSKTDSDVNRVIFDILPRLKKGVLVHFHDIFFPFEYPKKWVMQWNGFGWNEDYILRAFLMYNDRYRIVMFNTFLETFHKDWFRQHMPDCLKDEGGSIWLQKM
ncbi:MAG TPA: class I SAM-dependent methyltransferase [Puia sp.]|nr:class I SAM-dependent methyltransferase [Puia sp.]